jgi:transaldolase
MSNQQTASTTNPVVALVGEGQSIWFDYITRDLVRSGELKRMIDVDGIRGMTSNPSIFQKALATGNSYDEQVKTLAATTGDAEVIFEGLAVKDIQDACDVFRPLYDRLNGEDGYVSIEVSPDVAHDADATLAQALHLWATVNRPNVMIKVPGTVEGAVVVKALLEKGVNVNVTLLFSLESHERVMWSYIEALETRAAAGLPIGQIASVASFFISRVDVLVDKLLTDKAAATTDAAVKAHLQSLLGKAGIANAKLAYARFREIFDGPRFAALKAHGARVQRPLWASTGTKNPAYSDVLYVEELVGADTVNTVPQPTLIAFLNHGKVRTSITEDVAAATTTMAELEKVGIDFKVVTQQLEDEGITIFMNSYKDLIAGVNKKAVEIRGA